MNQIPFYHLSRADAEKQGQFKEWETSREADEQFVDEVERRADESLSGHEIGELVDDLIRNYGLERAMIMLARTVQFRARDKHISDHVREHAAKLLLASNEEEEPIDPCIYPHKLPPRIADALYRQAAVRLDEQENIIEEQENEDEAEQEI